MRPWEINSVKLLKLVSTIPDECMEVGTDLIAVIIIGNEVIENRSGRQLYQW